MSTTTRTTHDRSNAPSGHLINDVSSPPASNATPALDDHLDGVGAMTAAAAAPKVDGSTYRRTTLWREKLVFTTMCGALFLSGWKDSATGPLLPRIQEVYHVRV